MNKAGKIEGDQGILSKWQEKANLLYEIMGASAVVIMKVYREEIEVFVRSDNEDNPYVAGTRGELSIGSYCDAVVSSKNLEEISNAEEDIYWSGKVEHNKGMKSYLGLPILYPNEDLFGTLCVLNKDSRDFNKLDRRLFEHFRKSIESDLIIQEQNDIIRHTSVY